MIRSGLLDRRVQLRHRVLPTNDPNGQRKPTYSRYVTVWARKEEIVGTESSAGDTKRAESTSRFTIRYRSDVLLTDRLVFEGRDFDITDVSEIGRREGLSILATAVVP